MLKQIVNFLGFSGVGWILDFATYTIFALLSVNLFLCNVFGAIVGVTFVFIFSTRYIFQNNSKIPLITKYFIYIFYQALLVFLISKLLVWVNLMLNQYGYFSFIIKFSPILSKILITPITMICNFIVLKGIIEKL